MSNETNAIETENQNQTAVETPSQPEPTTKPEAKKKAGKPKAKKEALALCACGCGSTVKRVFKQGHDQRLWGLLLRVEEGHANEADVKRCRKQVAEAAKRQPKGRFAEAR